jgi:hypothetical protein
VLYPLIRVLTDSTSFFEENSFDGYGHLLGESRYNVDTAISSVKELLNKEKHLSPALRSALELLLLLVGLLLNQVTLNSKNSSKPPFYIALSPWRVSQKS